MSKRDLEVRYQQGVTKIRKDIRELDLQENLTDRDNLIQAWALIQNNPPDPDNGNDDPNTTSFFNIAGFHGEPFRGAGYDNPQWWGGYCNHGNVLFPTWHRAYLLCLENALENALNKERKNSGLDPVSIALPFWDQLDTNYQTKPVPEIFLQKDYTYLNGKQIDNPLYSYTLSRAIYDRLNPIPDADYSKYKGYQTVRYPFSGLVGTNDAAATNAHNSLMNELNVLSDEVNNLKNQTTDSKMTDGLLQSNVSKWLWGTVINDKGEPVGGGTADNYLASITAPNYTVFSNTTSAQRWNDDLFDEAIIGKPGSANNAVVPLEKPHNAVHLAVGGFEVPGIADYSYVPGANGDMGENDTAAFDPIFYFHHCFIDLVFWKWQLEHDDSTTKLDLLEGYPGTNSVDSQGPTPGIPGNTWLNLKTPLSPFGQTSDASGILLISLPPSGGDVTNIVDLGYNYKYDWDGKLQFKIPLVKPSPPSKAPPAPEQPKTPVSHIRISGVNRADAKGSFFLSAWASEPGSDEKTLVGLEPVLSRWHVNGCANCGTHPNISTVITLPKVFDQSQNFDVLVHTRDGRMGQPSLGGKKPNIRLGNMVGRK